MIGEGKILLCMQCFPGDQAQAIALSRLIADLEPAKCQYADFAWLIRFDCTPDSIPTDHLTPKFDRVYVIKGARRVTGWPQGCNAMVMDLMAYIQSRKDWNYDAIMLMEADCLPLRASWIKELLTEWQFGAHLSAGPYLVLGDWIGGRDISASHLNGNLLFSPRLLSTIRPCWNSSVVSNVAWDAEWWRRYAKYTRASRLIFSDYRIGTPSKPWQGCEYLWAPKIHSTNKTNPLYGVPLQPCWLHGCKDPRGIECVRSRLNLTEVYSLP